MTQLTPLERELLAALESLLSIRHRISGCPDKNCSVCRENKVLLEKADAAVAKAQKISEGAK